MADLTLCQTLIMCLLLLFLQLSFLLLFRLLFIFIGPDLAEVKFGHQGARPSLLLRGTSFLCSSDSCLLLILSSDDNGFNFEISHFSFQLPYRSVSLFDLVFLGAELLSQSFVLFTCLTLLRKLFLHLTELLVQLSSLVIHILPLVVHQ